MLHTCYVRFLTYFRIPPPRTLLSIRIKNYYLSMAYVHGPFYQLILRVYVNVYGPVSFVMPHYTKIAACQGLNTMGTGDEKQPFDGILSSPVLAVIHIRLKEFLKSMFFNQITRTARLYYSSLILYSWFIPNKKLAQFCKIHRNNLKLPKFRLFKRLL